MIDPAQPDFSNTPASSLRPDYSYVPGQPVDVPVVSIVTPFYNTGEVFFETARSVLKQSFQQWEWLIVNDGSDQHESLDILDRFRKMDPRIIVLDLPENQGPSRARNLGFTFVRGMYVLQLDSDDLLEPTAAEKWLWFLEGFSEYAFVKGYSVGFGAKEYLWNHGFHDGAGFLKENLADQTALLRKFVIDLIGGYDEENRNGLEDWDFWLKCAAHGYWGHTIPEYLSWYRRRENHQDRWANWADETLKEKVQATFRQRYAHLWQGGFPSIRPKWHTPYEPVSSQIPFSNPLDKTRHRLLMVLPWLSIGGADKFNLDLLDQLIRNGWEVTIVTTAPGDHSWESEFYRFTPDIFVLSRFLRMVDYPRFLQYLIRSRGYDVVMISNSELGYLLLPYLRAHCPGPVYLDYCHMEEDYWKNGGHPRKAVVYQDMLDLNITASRHLKDWMVKNGANPEKIQVCYINVDTNIWLPDISQRELLRKQFKIPETMPVILFAGRLVEQKRPLLLVKILARLAQTGLEFMAVIIGDGPLRQEVQDNIHGHPHLSSKIYLPGFLPNEQIRHWMQAADIFLLPSEQEGIALTIYEAFACGIPVVSADVGGQAELVTPDCGILIGHSNEQQELEAYASAISMLLQDVELSQSMGCAARERVISLFGIEDMAKNMLALFVEAETRKSEHPVERISPAAGNVAAQEAIESMRLFYLAEELWMNKDRVQLPPGKLSLYLRIRSWLLPAYTRLGGGNIPLLSKLKNILKKYLAE